MLSWTSYKFLAIGLVTMLALNNLQSAVNIGAKAVVDDLAEKVQAIDVHRHIANNADPNSDSLQLLSSVETMFRVDQLAADYSVITHNDFAKPIHDCDTECHCLCSHYGLLSELFHYAAKLSHSAPASRHHFSITVFTELRLRPPIIG